VNSIKVVLIIQKFIY